MSDIPRLTLSRKCMLTISVPFVAFFNPNEQTFYTGLTSQFRIGGFNEHSN